MWRRCCGRELVDDVSLTFTNLCNLKISNLGDPLNYIIMRTRFIGSSTKILHSLNVRICPDTQTVRQVNRRDHLLFTMSDIKLNQAGNWSVQASILVSRTR